MVYIKFFIVAVFIYIVLLILYYEYISETYQNVQYKYNQNDLEYLGKARSSCSETSWANRNKDRKLITHVPNTVIEIRKLENTNIYKIKLHTADEHGKNKTFGGDSWLVKIKNSDISFSIDLSDNFDGSYEGNFTVPQAGKYSVIFVIDYSLCEGILDPPLDWFSRGSFQGLCQRRPVDKIKHLINGTLVKEIEIPSASSTFNKCYYKLPDTCIHLNSKYGYWKHNIFKGCREINTKLEEKNNPTVTKLSEYKTRNTKLDTLLFFGDSLTKFFYNSINQTDICKHLFKECKLAFIWAYVKGRYSTEQEDHTLYDNKDFNETIFFDGISYALNNPMMHSKKSVIVINFGIHTITNLQYRRMSNLFRMFLDYIDDFKNKHRSSAPLIIWKSMTEPGQISKYGFALRFMTSQRARIWNEFTIEEACKRNLSILHLHHMSSSYPDGARDQSHYHPTAFKSAEVALYKYLQSYNFDQTQC